MNANELRIGNWVLDENMPYTVCIGMFGREWEGDDIFKQLQPIPLTKRIMVKCGFTKGECFTRHDKTRCLMLGDKPIIGYGAEGGPGEHKPEKHFFVCGYMDQPFYGHYVEIEYVHQLQNLYFALTGEELDIELW